MFHIIDYKVVCTHVKVKGSKFLQNYILRHNNYIQNDFTFSQFSTFFSFSDLQSLTQKFRECFFGWSAKSLVKILKLILNFNWFIFFYFSVRNRRTRVKCALYDLCLVQSDQSRFQSGKRLHAAIQLSLTLSEIKF